FTCSFTPRNLSRHHVELAGTDHARARDAVEVAALVADAPPDRIGRAVVRALAGATAATAAREVERRAAAHVDDHAAGRRAAAGPVHAQLPAGAGVAALAA